MNNNIFSLNRDYIMQVKSNTLHLETLALKNFRNFSHLTLKLPNNSILIYGENGCGKTNILESISLLTQGRGLRKAKNEDYLSQNSFIHDNQNSWGINARLNTPIGKFNIGTGIKDAKEKKSRVVRINFENASQIQLGKIIKVSWITPQMCVMFQSSMSEKRRFIDYLTSSIDPSHLNRVYKYQKLLRQRNNILFQPCSDVTWINTIEKQISELAVSIVASRLDLLEYLNGLFIEEKRKDLLINNFPPVEIKFNGLIENLLLKKNAVEVEDYVKSNLQKSRLSQETDICGPQISQIEIYNRLNKKNINISSTGEQKLLLISLILSHARMLNVRFNFPPILLLDDIVEHLDEKHRNALYKEVSKHCAQSFFTSTSLSAFEAYPHEIDKIHLPTVKNNFKSYYDFEME